MSEKFPFVNHFKISPRVENVDHVLNCLCQKWAGDNEIEHTPVPNLCSEFTIDVEELYGVVLFISMQSAH